ncbi:MAG: tRNA (pseudouridine(54)-N(1))-methyltransferase TrmY [ANME-2 cluster archaeon]|nr:tRNA (pseudouridine(54)-N(1))-methyltransferase TrmY [ANME-2 cluster archaeon]MDF1557860.1 tRNA (pseudouridine(54)-N(1))-methyltransferase TrmY [ANME-2 cluster archaeon]
MREFIVVGHKAVTDGQFSLNDLPGSAGRMDIMCRCINSALFLSHDLRRDVVVYLVLLGEPQPPKIVKFIGQDVRYLNPDERSSGSLIKKALELTARARWRESTSGVWVRQGDLEGLLSELNSSAAKGDDNRLYYLREDGTDIRDVIKEEMPQPSTFILGDHVGMTPDEEQKIMDAGARTLNVGPVSLHADHCIIVVNNELDRNNERKGCD